MPSGNLNPWSEQLRTGGAEILFLTYPDDADLSKIISNTFKVSVSEEQVKRDRQRFFRRPRRGERREAKEATPTKKVISNKALQLDVKQAFVEILDNIFDNRDRNKPDKLKVQIVAYPRTDAAPGEIIITENSGGIERERIVPLIQLGLSEKSSGSIGAWGEGFKMAIFALGQEIEVFSNHPKEPQPIAIHFPKGWLDESSSLWLEWKVNTYSVENPPSPGTTIIRINHLLPRTLQELGLEDNSKGMTPESACKELADYFGEVYAEKYRNLVTLGFDVSISIAIENIEQAVQFMKPVKTRLQESLAFIPWLCPIHWTGSLSTELEEIDKKRTARLNVEIYAGLAATFNYSPRYSPQDVGVEMWGNGRLFSLQGKIEDESVGWGYVFGGGGGSNPNATASARRLTIVALFTAEDSRDIPWAAPVKNDYNRRSEFYAELREILAKTIRLFKDAQTILANRLLPFSHTWTLLSDNEKLESLFEDSDATDEFKSEFASSRFGKKILRIEPTFIFHELAGFEQNPTVHSEYKVKSELIRDIVTAARETKQSATQIVYLLKGIFGDLAKQADIEEAMGLSSDEGVSL
jgi:hypothetical protein